ncbi:MAG: hypothetical protein Q8Q14_03680 [Gemmatimonadales bacterium]|nr:hypothetical protein [Gemmatimonadales bacterium]
MRTAAVALTLVVLLLAPARPARAQFSLDARRIGMGGVSLSRGGDLRRFNPAYRAVKDRAADGSAPRLTIPIPLGLIDFLKEHPLNQLDEDPLFDPKSPLFNPVELMNLIFNPPIFYEVRKVPAPTNDVEVTIGKNAFVVDLGATQVLIPEQEFGLGSTSRLLDMGFGFAGFNIGVMGFLQYEVGFTLDDALRDVLKNADSVRANTSYRILGDGLVQAGLAPTISFAGRLTRGPGGEESDDGIYLGAALHYYMGATYARGVGPGGFTTGDPVFGTTPIGLLDDTLYTSNGPFGTGVGGDVGVAWISGPFEVGVGVNDIGAELTWSDTKAQRIYYHPLTDSLYSTVLVDHVETTTKLPITYIANAALRMGTGTTVGGEVVNSGRGTVIHVGVEQRATVFAVRGGIARDQRKKMQFGWGGGVRLGSVGLDVGFWTHSNSFADKRGITMATSISIY